MWILRELARLVLRVAIAAAVTTALAAFLALVGATPFMTAGRILCIVFGCMLLAMAGVGANSNVDRYMDQNVVKVAWGTIPGFDALKRHPEDPTLAPGAIFFCSGLVVIALGILVF
ncbi:MAG TPA: hypothetical protein VHC67_18165 [Gaiellaceae bacterium]|jgi:hypothetical protein|nr:hypothetical protein [Gaiellaceae bacterium]